MANITDGELVGCEAVMVYNTATHATPTWVVITRAKDISLSAPKSKAEISSRASRFKYKRGALKELSLELGYMYRRGTDAIWTMFNDSYVNGTIVEFWVGDGAITLTGAKGWRFYGEVTEFSMEQPLEDADVYKITIDPAPFYVSSAIIEPDVFIVP